MSKSFDSLVEVMAQLRGSKGCPWDQEQTSASLKPFLIEEAYEVLDAIETGQPESLCEELGDLLFQVLFHAEIAKEKGEFDIENIIKAITEKMIRRHPHVFSPEKDSGVPIDKKTVLARWEEIKKTEKRNSDSTRLPLMNKGKGGYSVLDGIPKQLPALLRAHQVQVRASRLGFDWLTLEPVLAKVEEELLELREAIKEKKRSMITHELGDLLFSVINVGRFLKVNPEDALRGTIERFTWRFKKMETEAAGKGITLDALSLEELDLLWEQAKASESV